MTCCHAYLPMALLGSAQRLLKEADYLICHSTSLVGDDFKKLRDSLRDAQDELKKTIQAIAYGETRSSEMKVVIDEFTPKRLEDIDVSALPEDTDEWRQITRCCIVALYPKVDYEVIEIFLDGNLFEIRMGQNIPGTNWRVTHADTDYVHFQNDNIKAQYHKSRKERHE